MEQADSKQLDNRYEARYKTRDRCPQTNQINHISAYPSSRFLSRPLFNVFASPVTRNSSHSRWKAIEKNFDESRRNDYSKQFAILWELSIPLRFSRFSSSLLSLSLFFFFYVLMHLHPAKIEKADLRRRINSAGRKSGELIFLVQ